MIERPQIVSFKWQEMAGHVSFSDLSKHQINANQKDKSF